MRDRQPRVSTEYKSLYPSNSANQVLAIQRIAANENSAPEPQTEQEGHPVVPGGILVRRQYHPEKAALSDLIEALYHLLTERLDAHGAKAVDPTCLCPQPE
jgi:hypothetical protein